MAEKMFMTINLHHACVENVITLGDNHPADQFVITLGNDNGYGNTLDMFTSDAEWEEMVATVAKKRAILKAERARRDAEKIRCAECNRTDQAMTVMVDVCDECAEK